MPRSSSASSAEKCHFSALSLVSRSHSLPSNAVARLHKRASNGWVLDFVHKVSDQRLQRSRINHLPELFECIRRIDLLN